MQRGVLSRDWYTRAAYVAFAFPVLLAAAMIRHKGVGPLSLGSSLLVLMLLLVRAPKFRDTVKKLPTDTQAGVLVTFAVNMAAQICLVMLLTLSSDHQAHDHAYANVGKVIVLVSAAVQAAIVRSIFKAEQRAPR